MRVKAGPQFVTFLNGLREAGGRPYELVMALLAVLRRLQCKPTDDTATIKRVRQAKRHEVWRLAHPYEPGCAVRVLCWFPDDTTAVVALIGGDKAAIGDVWYDSATPRAEAQIDQWLREHERDDE